MVLAGRKSGTCHKGAYGPECYGLCGPHLYVHWKLPRGRPSAQQLHAVTHGFSNGTRILKHETEQ